MVQLHTSGRYNIRRNVTKSERYKNGTVHDFSLWRNAKCSVQCTVMSVISRVYTPSLRYTDMWSQTDIYIDRSLTKMLQIYVSVLSRHFFLLWSLTEVETLFSVYTWTHKHLSSSGSNKGLQPFFHIYWWKMVPLFETFPDLMKAFDA